MLTYAGIGARSTPPEVLNQMAHLGQVLADMGFKLRSGGAAGADRAFQDGCESVRGPMEIYLPFEGFNGQYSNYDFLESQDIPQATAVAKRFHPAWDSLKETWKSFHVRNGFQILGPKLDSPCNLVACWTEGGALKGGTAQALRIAKAYDIPVFNLALCASGDIIDFASSLVEQTS